MSGALPYATAGLPGSGGRLKCAPEDFQVDERPAYLPSGAGPHLYLHVEKRGLTTRDAVRSLARALGVPERDAGYAGLKDKAAVTTQWLSFPAARDPDPASLAAPGLRVLAASRHQNKLRVGHARGNAFQVVVRDGALGPAAACAERLSRTGLPNYFGPQRFGTGGANAALGRALLAAEPTPEARRASRDRFLRRFALSALQAELYNAWLAERLGDGLFDRVLPGDPLKKLDTGGLFVCEDAAVDGARLARFEVSQAGPMFGHALTPGAGEPAAREARVLAAAGLALADFARGGEEAKGTRRAARLPVTVDLDPIPDGYRARFELPRGSYATVVMRELMKCDADLPDDGE